MIGRHYSPRSAAIVMTELGWILLSLGGAVALDVALQGKDLHLDELARQVAGATILYLGAFYYSDLYNFSDLQLRRELVTAAVRAFSALALTFGLLFICTRLFTFHSVTIFFHLVVTTAVVIALRPRIDAALTRYGVVTRIAIVGTGAEAQGLAHEITRRHEHGHEVACFVATEGTAGTLELGSPNPGIRAVPVITSDTLLDFARRQRVKRILVSSMGGALPADDLLRCKAEGIGVEDGHTFYERLLGRIFTADLRPEWLIFSDGFSRPAAARVMKRAVDLVAATCLLVLTAPLCLLVALAIKIEDGGPVHYRQSRVGLGGVPFTLRKFRSMSVDAEVESGPKWAEADDPRVTRVGRCIRVLRIDEIAQAWNVLVGDMSFVGPRPERPEFVSALEAAIPYYAYRHTVRPGITGWAQIHLPYTASVEDARLKFEYDLYYLKNFSVLMDLLILFRTVKIILFGWGSR